MTNLYKCFSSILLNQMVQYIYTYTYIVYSYIHMDSQTWLSIKRIRKFVKQTLCFLFNCQGATHTHTVCMYMCVYVCMCETIINGPKNGNESYCFVALTLWKCLWIFNYKPAFKNFMSWNTIFFKNFTNQTIKTCHNCILYFW